MKLLAQRRQEGEQVSFVRQGSCIESIRNDYNDIWHLIIPALTNRIQLVDRRSSQFLTGFGMINIILTMFGHGIQWHRRGDGLDCFGRKFRPQTNFGVVIEMFNPFV